MRRISFCISVLVLLSVVSVPAEAQQRTLTFMDVQEMRRGGSWTPSPDGAWMLYTVTTPDWDEADSQTDIHIVPLAEGSTSSRQLTFTEDADEQQPAWGPDATYFAFVSDRDEELDGNQIYVMRPDGGEARRVTSAEEGVSDFRFSPDGRWLVYRSGKSGREQLHRLPTYSVRRRRRSRVAKQGSIDGTGAPTARRSTSPGRIPSTRRTNGGGSSASRST